MASGLVGDLSLTLLLLHIRDPIIFIMLNAIIVGVASLYSRGVLRGSLNVVVDDDTPKRQPVCIKESGRPTPRWDGTLLAR